MGKDTRDDLVTDVADALTLDQEVEWERCAGLATPADRRVLDGLRDLGAIFAGRPAAGAGLRSRAPTGAEPFAGARVRRVLHALLAIAALDVAAALLVLSSTWNDYRREHGELAVFLTTLFLGHVATACVLLLAGRTDQRAWLLGGFFLLKATLAPLHMVYASVWEIQPHLIEAFALEASAPAKLLAHVYVVPFLFAPAFLWAFARECPRIRRRTRLDGLTHRMVPGSLGSAARCGSPTRLRSSSRRRGTGRRLSSWSAIRLSLPCICRRSRRSRSSGCARARRRPTRQGASWCSAAGFCCTWARR